MRGSAEPQKRQPSARRAKLSAFLWLAGLFLTGLGAKLWLINTYGTSLPFWDQWDEARVVFIPYFSGHFSISDLFTPLNENRSIFTLIYSLTLVLINHQWDNRVEMVGNALLHTGLLTILAWRISRLIGGRTLSLAVIPFALVLGLPFAWENTLAGFHSQFYFMLFFSIFAIWLLVLREPLTFGWWCGALFSVLALFNLASGLIAAAAVCAWSVVRIMQRPAENKRQWLTIIVCIVAVALGMYMKVNVPHHKRLMAGSPIEFLLSLGKYLAWPWIVFAPIAVFNMLPFGLFAWRYWRGTTKRTPAAEIVLCLGIWVLLQAAAAAYARGHGGAHPQWRYMDITSFAIVVNALALLVLWTAVNQQGPLPRYFSAVTALWVVAGFSGILLLSFQAVRSDLPWRGVLHHMQWLTAEGYRTSQDKRFFDVRRDYLALFEGDPTKPQEHARILIDAMESPQIRSVLPACIRRPVAMQPERVIGFTTNDAATQTPHLSGEICWSSNEHTVTSERIFESLPIERTELPYLEFWTAGNFGERDLSLSLINLSDGKRKNIQARSGPEDTWQTHYVSATRGNFKVSAEDKNPNSWFAFQAPREVGRLSVWADEVIQLGVWIFFGGISAYVFGVSLAVKQRMAQLTRSTEK